MKTRRKAYTLVEMLVVISITAVLLSLVTMALGRMLRATREVHAGGGQQLAWDRLLEQLREDAHAAVEAEVREAAEGPAVLSLTLPAGRTVSYQATPMGLQRQVEVAGQTEHQDWFRIQQAESLRWKVAPQGIGQWIEIQQPYTAAASLPGMPVRHRIALNLFPALTAEAL